MSEQLDAPWLPDGSTILERIASIDHDRLTCTLDAPRKPAIFERAGNVSVRRCSTYAAAQLVFANPRHCREIMSVSRIVA